MNGLDVLGALASSAGDIYAFVDKDTITYVQKALSSLPAAVKDKVFQIKADGVKGPATDAAVFKFNKQYRGEPDDGIYITQGTLDSLKLDPLSAPVKVSRASVAKASGGAGSAASSGPAASAPTPTASTVANWWSTMPTWQKGLAIGLGALAVVGVGGWAVSAIAETRKQRLWTRMANAEVGAPVGKLRRRSDPR